MIRLFDHAPTHLAEDYAYDMQTNGVDNLWRIYHVTTNEIVAYVVYWDCDPDWAARAQAQARLIANALTAYANREGPPPAPQQLRYKLAKGSRGRVVSIVDTRKKAVFLEVSEEELAFMTLPEVTKHYSFIADALNAFGQP